MLAKKPRGHISMDVPYFESVLLAKICAKFRCEHLLLKCWFWDAAHLISGMQMRFKVFCTHAWPDAGPLKAKYPVNAVNFKRDL